MSAVIEQPPEYLPSTKKPMIHAGFQLMSPIGPPKHVTSGGVVFYDFSLVPVNQTS